VKNKPNYVLEQYSGNYLIKEKKTDQYIMSTDHRMPALSMLSKLNKGSGFEGETPSFMVKNILQVNIKNS
jgi:hypothetical protein